MKNYAEMSDFEINREVLSYFVKTGGKLLSYAYNGDGKSAGVYYKDVGEYLWYNFCNNWADAGSIIDQIFGTLTGTGKYDDGIGLGEREMSVWQAQMHHNNCGKLRAAMIVFLMMRDAEK